MDAFSRASRCFWLILGGYDVQLRVLEVIMFFWKEIDSARRKALHASGNQITTGMSQRNSGRAAAPPDGKATSVRAQYPYTFISWMPRYQFRYWAPVWPCSSARGWLPTRRILIDLT